MVEKSFSLFGREVFRVVRDRTGQFTYEFFSGSESAYSGNYLNLSLTNPVVMTVIAVRSRVYSKAKVIHRDRNGNVIENSPVVKLLESPNYFQSLQDFLFQQMWFLSATGSSYTYEIKPFATALPTALFNLIPSEMDFNEVQKLDKFITTTADFKQFGEQTVKYKLDNQTYNIPIKDIIPFYDLSNGLKPNTWMESPSRLKGLVKICQNIEENVKAKNINLQFAQKYLATNKTADVAPNITADDRKDITRKLNDKNVIISNSNIGVNHLVSDLKKLYLDEQFAQDALKILLAFDMNKDVLNYFGIGGSTYENQEKGELRYIQNAIMPIAESTANSFSQQFGLFAKGEKLEFSYDHLPLMQPVMNDKIDSFKKQQETLKLALENNTIDEAEARQMTDELLKRLGLKM